MTQPDNLAVAAVLILWAIIMGGCAWLLFGGRRDHHRLRRAHRDEMGARGLPTRFDDTGLLRPGPEWRRPNTGRFVRTKVRPYQGSDEKTLTRLYYRR